ncbi:MAG: hypothetical protein LUC17_01035 [Oscillospiraceae bacterium]|nr:hypothetical protein [Oscillospiraceae bacterium]
MSFVSVDFFGARNMADEIETMGGTCRDLAREPGGEELEELAGRLADIAADIRRACDEREKEDNQTLEDLRPDYGEILQ